MAENKNSSEIVFGIHPTLELLRSEKEVDRIFVLKTLKNEALAEIHQIARERKIPVIKVPVEKLNNITRKIHQGVIGLVSAITYSSLDYIVDACFNKGKMPLVLILDRITDVRNFGAICRTAECAGVDAIVIPDKGAAQINSDAMKTSAGALSYIPVCRTDNLLRTFRKVQAMGLATVSCTEKTDELVYDAHYDGPTAIIMGSEETGVSDEILRNSDFLAKIPMNGKVGSLNVSAACSVILYEAVRQRLDNA